MKNIAYFVKSLFTFSIHTIIIVAYDTPAKNGKTYERKHGFLLYMLIKWIAPFAIGTIGSIFMIIPLIGYLVGLVLQLVNMAAFIAGYIAKAIVMIDLMDLYMKKDEKGLAIFLGIVSLFAPIVFPITCIVLCTKEPEFGYGNYYYPVNLQTIE